MNHSPVRSRGFLSRLADNPRWTYSDLRLVSAAHRSETLPKAHRRVSRTSKAPGTLAPAMGRSRGLLASIPEPPLTLPESFRGLLATTPDSLVLAAIGEALDRRSPVETVLQSQAPCSHLGEHLGLLPVQRRRRGWEGAIVTNPNCALVLVMPLAALRGLNVHEGLAAGLRQIARCLLEPAPSGKPA
jgi:hypothetical protein